MGRHSTAVQPVLRVDCRCIHHQHLRRNYQHQGSAVYHRWSRWNHLGRYVHTLFYVIRLHRE